MPRRSPRKPSAAPASAAWPTCAVLPAHLSRKLFCRMIPGKERIEQHEASEAPGPSRAGDALLLPVALAASWTLAYQLVLVARWPAWTIVWFWFPITALELFSLVRLWARTNTLPILEYRFHPSHLLLLVLAIGCAITPLFLRLLSHAFRIRSDFRQGIWYWAPPRGNVSGDSLTIAGKSSQYDRSFGSQQR